MEFFQEKLTKMKDFLVEILTYLAPDLSIGVTSSFFALKQKSISSFKICNKFMLVHNVEKSNKLYYFLYYL